MKANTNFKESKMKFKMISEDHSFIYPGSIQLHDSFLEKEFLFIFQDNSCTRKNTPQVKIFASDHECVKFTSSGVKSLLKDARLTEDVLVRAMKGKPVDLRIFQKAISFTVLNLLFMEIKHKI
jgi:hypothetical protein